MLKMYSAEARENLRYYYIKYTVKTIFVRKHSTLHLSFLPSLHHFMGCAPVLRIVFLNIRLFPYFLCSKLAHTST